MALLAFNDEAVVVQVVFALARAAGEPLPVVVPLELILIKGVVLNAVGTLTVEGKKAVAQTAVANDQTVGCTEDVVHVVLAGGGDECLFLRLPVVQLGIDSQDSILRLHGNADKDAWCQRIESMGDDASIVKLSVERKVTRVVYVVLVVGVATGEQQQKKASHQATYGETSQHASLNTQHLSAFGEFLV